MTVPLYQKRIFCCGLFNLHHGKQRGNYCNTTTFCFSLLLTPKTIQFYPMAMNLLVKLLFVSALLLIPSTAKFTWQPKV